jgi:hypothetical protein
VEHFPDFCVYAWEKEGTRMRIIVLVLALAALAGFAVADVNVTGKWTGSFKVVEPEGEGGTAVLMLTQTGSEITGTVGPDEGEQHTITKGKIEGGKITIVVEEDGRAIKFDLLATADRISGDVDISHDGQTRKAKIDVTRAK